MTNEERATVVEFKCAECGVRYDHDDTPDECEQCGTVDQFYLVEREETE